MTRTAKLLYHADRTRQGHLGQIVIFTTQLLQSVGVAFIHRNHKGRGNKVPARKLGRNFRKDSLFKKEVNDLVHECKHNLRVRIDLGSFTNG